NCIFELSAVNAVMWFVLYRICTRSPILLCANTRLLQIVLGTKQDIARTILCRSGLRSMSFAVVDERNSRHCIRKDNLSMSDTEVCVNALLAATSMSTSL